MAQRLYAKAIRSDNPIMSSIARVYPDVNVHNPASYWDYENLSIEWGYAPFLADSNSAFYS